jgi:calcineurin-like phosphoesterase family protein
MRWFTSDWHLGHTNIIKYCDRPFRSTRSMDDFLISQANGLLTPDDELWILGDIAFGAIEETLTRYQELIPQLVIVTGNHDRPHPSFNSKNDKDEWLQTYKSLTGAKQIINGNTIITLTDETRAHVSHFPRTPEDHTPSRIDRFGPYRPPMDGLPVIHGHTHGLWQQHHDHIDVGVDAWGGQLVPEDTLARLLREKKDRPKIPWALS